MSELFSQEKLAEQLKKLPENEANIGVVTEGKDIGITGSVSKDIGKPGGWWFGAEGTWVKAKSRIAAMFSWKG